MNKEFSLTCTAYTENGHTAERPVLVAETFLLGGGGRHEPVTGVLHQHPDVYLGILLQLLDGLLEEEDPGVVHGVVPLLPPVSVQSVDIRLPELQVRRTRKKGITRRKLDEDQNVPDVSEGSVMRHSVASLVQGPQQLVDPREHLN